MLGKFLHAEYKNNVLVALISDDDGLKMLWQKNVGAEFTYNSSIITGVAWTSIVQLYDTELSLRGHNFVVMPIERESEYYAAKRVLFEYIER